MYCMFYIAIALFSDYSEPSKFYNNSGSTSGILDVTYSPLRMIGYNIFQNNIGPSLRVSAHAESIPYIMLL